MVELLPEIGDGGLVGDVGPAAGDHVRFDGGGVRPAGGEVVEHRLVRVDRGFTDLGVTGGEPFLLTWLPETLAAMSDQLPVQISLDRPGPDANDEMRGPANFRKVVESVPKHVSRGARVRIATTVESIEDTELERLCALQTDLPAELTIAANGAFWSPFGPTVHGGRLDTDLLWA